MQTFDHLNNADKPLLIAHRGSSARAHENTMAAFRAAVADGADAIELDVRRTADRVIVVHHNANIIGTRRRIASMSFEEVEAAAARQSYRVPTLEEVVAYCRDRIALDVELKESGYEEEVASCATALGQGAVVFTSFLGDVVQRLKAIVPDRRVGLLIGAATLRRGQSGKRLPGVLPSTRLRRSGADFVAPHWRLMRLGLVARARRLQMPVFVWTVNDDRVARRAIRLGVNAIITNDPARIRRCLDTG